MFIQTFTNNLNNALYREIISSPVSPCPIYTIILAKNTKSPDLVVGERNSILVTWYDHLCIAHPSITIGPTIKPDIEQSLKKIIVFSL